MTEHLPPWATQPTPIVSYTFEPEAAEVLRLREENDILRGELLEAQRNLATRPTPEFREQMRQAGNESARLRKEIAELRAENERWQEDNAHLTNQVIRATAAATDVAQALGITDEQILHAKDESEVGELILNAAKVLRSWARDSRARINAARKLAGGHDDYCPALASGIGCECHLGEIRAALTGGA